MERTKGKNKKRLQEKRGNALANLSKGKNRPAMLVVHRRKSSNYLKKKTGRRRPKEEGTVAGVQFEEGAKKDTIQ